MIILMYEYFTIGLTWMFPRPVVLTSYFERCLKDIGKCNSKFCPFSGPVLLDEFVEWQKVRQAS